MDKINAKTVIIQNGTLIDGSGNPAVPNQAVVIQGNRILSVGPVPPEVNLEDRENVQVIDATGQWVMPGLIDGHCHLSFGPCPEAPGSSTWPFGMPFPRE